MKLIDIEKFLSLETYNTEERLLRKKGAGGTQEVFTPYVLVKKMCDKIFIKNKIYLMEHIQVLMFFEFQ